MKLSELWREIEKSDASLVVFGILGAVVLIALAVLFMRVMGKSGRVKLVVLFIPTILLGGCCMNRTFSYRMSNGEILNLQMIDTPVNPEAQCRSDLHREASWAQFRYENRARTMSK